MFVNIWYSTLKYVCVKQLVASAENENLFTVKKAFVKIYNVHDYSDLSCIIVVVLILSRPVQASFVLVKTCLGHHCTTNASFRKKKKNSWLKKVTRLHVIT